MIPDALRPYIGSADDVLSSPLAELLVQLCHEFHGRGGHLGLALAAAFDLYVASEYYNHIEPENWLWCEESGLDVYQYSNACPTCMFDYRFVHHAGHKPQSGVIGGVTAAALPEIIRHHYRVTGTSGLEVTSGREPVDLAIIEQNRSSVFMAEVKASPLFTPPVAVRHQRANFVPQQRLPGRHSAGTLRNMSEFDALLLYPDDGDTLGYIELPQPQIGTPGWASISMLHAFQDDPEPFFAFVQGWIRLWQLYLDRSDDACSTPSFWFTGGCGGPPVAGDGWPMDGRGRPRGSISDSKTSVGMDRTDDIKKGTFQVLMMGVDLHQMHLDGWQLKVGLASNLHAGRHHEDYLARYEDIAWGWLSAGCEPPGEWYRLFDAIVSFSRSYTSDPWLQEVLNWH